MIPPIGSLVVVGARGRIGSLILGMRDGPLVPLGITRGQAEWRLDLPGPAVPILLSVRNDELDGLISGIHPQRWNDLVLVGNGLLAPWQMKRDLSGATLGVLWVAVTHPGAPPVPGGTSTFCGPWAEPIAALLNGHGVAAAAVDRLRSDREVAIKLGWICCLGLLGERLQGRVGDVLEQDGDLLEALLVEIHPALRAVCGLDLDLGDFRERIMSYSAGIAHFPARAKEWPWRNGALLLAAEERGQSLPLMKKLATELGLVGVSG